MGRNVGRGFLTVGLLAAILVLALLLRMDGRDQSEDIQSAVAPPSAPPGTEMLWLAEDHRLRRATVDVAHHALFAATIAASIAEDRKRLAAAVGPRLRSELDAALQPMEARAPALAQDAFSSGTVYALLTRALMLPGDDTRSLEAQVREILDAHVFEAYLGKVVQPQVAMPRVRAAVGVAFADTRRDVLRNCDKYDQAFQGFLAREARRVEVLSAGTGWIPDETWTSAPAGYRTLCPAARLAGAMGGVIDASVYDELSARPSRLFSLTEQRAEHIAAVIRESHATAREIVGVLSGLGLAPAWTAGPARVLAMAAWAPDLRATIAADFDDGVKRAEVVTATRASVTGARERFHAKVEQALRRFVDLELEGMAVRLSIPIEKLEETSGRTLTVPPRSLL
ncbi:MAG: hypothetical protein H7840_15140 [Alphaproteobacteria bacterium]